MSQKGQGNKDAHCTSHSESMSKHRLDEIPDPRLEQIGIGSLEYAGKNNIYN